MRSRVCDGPASGQENRLIAGANNVGTWCSPVSPARVPTQSRSALHGSAFDLPAFSPFSMADGTPRMWVSGQARAGLGRSVTVILLQSGFSNFGLPAAGPFLVQNRSARIGVAGNGLPGFGGQISFIFFFMQVARTHVTHPRPFRSSARNALSRIRDVRQIRAAGEPLALSIRVHGGPDPDGRHYVRGYIRETHKNAEIKWRRG